MNILKVNSIETLGTQEGPGIRFVVFTQGCNFRCLYCHNPETQSLSGEKLKAKGIRPKEYTAPELIEKIKKCLPYYGKNGAVTVSGGEPLLQAKALLELFLKLKKQSIHTAIDTNGSILNSDVKKLLKLTDLVLLDVKHINDEWHKKLSGQSNSKTLEFAKYLEDNKIKFWIRYVLVPGLTDQEEFLKELANHFKEFDNIERIEILPYHSLSMKKYEELGMSYPLDNTPIPTKEQIHKAKKIFESAFKKVVVR